MIAASDFRRGTKIEYKDEPFEVIDFQHVKMGRGSAFVRAKIKGLKSNRIFEETFNPNDKYPKADLNEVEMQYLYNQNGEYFFMDLVSYEQHPISEALIGDAKLLLKENMNVQVLFHKDKPLTVELPIFVELIVSETEPGFKGDTASGGNKPAKLETGASIKVPFHINSGDMIKVDTRNLTYIERVK
ncbi:MAG: elongation factor P [Nitrospirae bacterium]|nr:elongation factor P [Nitrospirota bacterium]MBF0541658.1 elongation factor P [Nitrospirota bacterium]